MLKLVFTSRVWSTRRQLVAGIVIALVFALAITVYFASGRAAMLAVALCAIPPAIVLLLRPVYGLGWCLFAFTAGLNVLVPFIDLIPLTLTFGAVIVRKLFLHDLTWRVTPFVGAWLLLAVFMLASLVWIPVIESRYMVSFFDSTIFVLLVTELVRTPRDFVFVLSAIGGGVLFTAGSSVLGLYQFLTEGLRNPTMETLQTAKSARFFGHWLGPNALSHTVAPFLPLFLPFVIARRRLITRFAASIVVLSGMLAVALALTRASIIHLAVAMTATVWLSRFRWRLIGLAALTLVIIGSILPMDVFGRLEALTGSKSDSSLGERAKILNVALTMVGESFPFGSGTESFRLYQQDYNPQLHITVFHAHNAYAQVLLENGLIGFLLFLLMLIAAFQPLYNLKVNPKDGEFRYLLGVSLAATFVGMLICFTSEYVVPWASYWVPFAMMSVFPMVYSDSETDVG